MTLPRVQNTHSQDNHNDGRRPRHHVEQARVYILAHQFFFVDEQQHEDQTKAARCRSRPGTTGDLSAAAPGSEVRHRAGHDQERVEPVEDRGLAKLFQRPTRTPGPRTRYRRSKRQNRRSEQRRVEQSDREQNVGIVPGERPERLRRIRRSLMLRKPWTYSVAAHATMMNQATTSVKMQPTIRPAATPCMPRVTPFSTIDDCR